MMAKQSRREHQLKRIAQPVVVTAVRLDELEISLRQGEVGEQISRRDVDREAIEAVAFSVSEEPDWHPSAPGRREWPGKGRGAVLPSLGDAGKGERCSLVHDTAPCPRRTRTQ